MPSSAAAACSGSKGVQIHTVGGQYPDLVVDHFAEFDHVVAGGRLGTNLGDGFFRGIDSRFVDELTGVVDHWRDQFAAADSCTQLQMFREPAQVEHAGDAMLQEYWSVAEVGPSPHVFLDVHVRIDQSRHQPGALSINAPCVRWRGVLGHRHDSLDAPVRHQHGMIGQHPLFVHGHHMDILDADRHRRFRHGRQGTEEQNCPGQDQASTQGSIYRHHDLNLECWPGTAAGREKNAIPFRRLQRT
jgi:hypothetical protein